MRRTSIGTGVVDSPLVVFHLAHLEPLGCRGSGLPMLTVLFPGALARHDTPGPDVEPVEREPAQDLGTPAPQRDPTRTRAEELRAGAQRLAQRAEAERRRHRSVDAAFEIADRDSDVGGGIMAGALAYRLFIWLLPRALVAVAGLRIAADVSSGSPEDAAESLGFEGLISNSIASAANSPNRWYALLIGVPVLVWATRSLLRVLIVTHRLVWA